MWVAGEGGFVIVYGNLAEGIPAHEMLWKLEVAVLHHLSIQAAVGTEVDILKKDAVHCRLYIGIGLVASTVSSRVCALAVIARVS